MAGGGWINSLLGLGAVAAIEAGLDDTEDLVGLLARGLRVDGGDVGKMVPVLVAGGRQKGLLELDDGRGAGGDVLEHDELTLGGEHVGKGVGGLGVLGRGVEPAKGRDYQNDDQPGAWWPVGISRCTAKTNENMCGLTPSGSPQRQARRLLQVHNGSSPPPQRRPAGAG